MKIFSSKKRAAAIGAVTAATLIGGSVAFAYWTSSGTGPGGATTGTSSPFNVTITQTSFDPLAPGDGSTQAFDVRVENPGAGALQLDSVVAAVKSGWSVAVSGLPACDSDDFAVSAVNRKDTSFADLTGLGKTELQPAGTWLGTFTVTMNNLTTNQDSCKALSFDPLVPDSGVPLVATASS